MLAAGNMPVIGPLERRVWCVLAVTALMLMSGCSGDGTKNEASDEDETSETAAPVQPGQGRWVAVPPNMVWVPQQQGAVPAAGYGQYRQPQPAAQPPGYQQPGYQQQPRYGGGVDQGNNPWSAPHTADPRQARSQWGQPQYQSQQRQWPQAAPQQPQYRQQQYQQQYQPPQYQQPQYAQPRYQYRPLDNDGQQQAPVQQQPVQQQPVQRGFAGGGWTASAPYDRPGGSSANPGHQAPAVGAYGYGGGYPGATYGGYGVGVVPGVGYGTGLPMVGGYPGVVPGVMW